MKSSRNLSKSSVWWLDLASSYCCFSDIAFNNKILMSLFFFLLFSRCAELLDLAHDYHLLTLDCSSVCYGAVSCISRVPVPVSPVTAAHSTPASPFPVRARPAPPPPRPDYRTTGTACHCFTCCWRGEETTAGIWWRALAGIHHLLQLTGGLTHQVGREAAGLVAGTTSRASMLISLCLLSHRTRLVAPPQQFGYFCCPQSGGSNIINILLPPPSQQI